MQSRRDCSRTKPRLKKLVRRLQWTRSTSRERHIGDGALLTAVNWIIFFADTGSAATAKDILGGSLAEVSASPSPKAPAKPAAATIPGDGTFLVPSEVKPGRYRSAGGEDCYWARLSGTSGELDDIIANDNPTGQTIVTVRALDKAFQTQRCGQWVKIG